MIHDGQKFVRNKAITFSFQTGEACGTDKYVSFFKNGKRIEDNGYSLTHKMYGKTHKWGNRYYTTIYLAWDGQVYTHTYQSDEKGKVIR